MTTNYPGQPCCDACGEPVDPGAPGVWRQVTGWVQNRRDGGANAVAMPSKALAWSCRSCMDRRRNGTLGMPSLFD
jgi:hypothetical protein